MSSHAHRAFGWPQENLRRGREAFRECKSRDVDMIIRAVGAALIRNQGDFAKLVEEQRLLPFKGGRHAASAEIEETAET
jgi:hypothetical protein